MPALRLCVCTIVVTNLVFLTTRFVAANAGLVPIASMPNVTVQESCCNNWQGRTPLADNCELTCSVVSVLHGNCHRQLQTLC